MWAVSNSKQILLATHRHLPWGTADRIAHHLMIGGHHVTLIEHPLLPTSEQWSKVIIRNQLVNQIERRPMVGIRYFRDFYLTSKWGSEFLPDIAIGFDALSAYALLYAFYGSTTKVVLYLVDWIDRPLLNHINRFVAEMVDQVWCVAPAIQDKLGIVDVQIVPNLPLRFIDQPVPIPDRLADINIGYIGHLTDEQDITPFLYALSIIPVDSRPFLLVAGDGPMYVNYKKICVELELDRVKFTGQLKTTEQLAGFYKDIHFGIVPYHANRSEKIANGDSIKLADYVTNFKFVIMTYLFDGIDDQGLGECVSRTPEEIARMLMQLPEKRINLITANAFYDDRQQKFYKVFDL